MLDKEFDIKQLFNVVKRRLYIFISIIVLVLVFTAIYIYRAQRIYKSVVMIEIEPRAANVLGRGMEVVSVGSPGYYWSNREYYATQQEIMKSREVCARVIESIPPSMLEKFLMSNRDPENELNLPEDGENKKEVDPVSILQGSISVSSQKDSNIFYISVRHADPEVATFFANTLASSYVDFNLEKKYVATKDAAGWLSEQSANLKDKLEKAETNLFEFREEKGVLASSFDARDEMLSDKIKRLQNEITEKEIASNALEAKFDQLKDFSGKSSIFNSDRMSDIIKNMKVKYFELQSELQKRSQFYGDRHPKVLEVVAAMEDLEQSIEKEAEMVVESVEKEVVALKSELRNLKKMLHSVKVEALNLNKLRIQYNKIQREVETTNKLYNIVLERTKEADLSSLLKSNNIRIIDKARVPGAPVEPKVRLIVLIGVLLALLMAMMGVFLIEFFDNRIHNFEELEKIMGSSILGVVPRFGKNRDSEMAEMAFEEEGHSSVVEAFRSIRTNIRLVSPDSDNSSFLITSSDSKEGKTTVSANVAVSFALSGKKVILIDTDMRKPRVHKVFNIKNDRGISNCMLDESTLDEVIRKDVYKGLDVLTCGPIPPNPPELIESMKFREITKKLKESYDVVIFDSPPVGAVTDAVVIASHVDSVILVVKIKDTGRDFLKNTVTQIKKADSQLLGSVVNNIDIKEGGRYGAYSYYYYQRSDYYGNEDNENI